MGNSEVGHLNLGAGAVVQAGPRAHRRGDRRRSFFENEALRRPARPAREPARLHLLGLVSDGGVHSALRSPARAASSWRRASGVARHRRCTRSPTGATRCPTRGAGYVAQAEGWLRARRAAASATVIGRYWAMDRDRRWDRTKLAYDAIVHGRGRPPRRDAARRRCGRLRARRDRRVHPADGGRRGRRASAPATRAHLQLPSRPHAPARRARSASRSFDEFDRGDAPRVELTTMTEYQEDWDYPVAFPPDRPRSRSPRCSPSAASAQLHVAETEKYAHVTYFFNGGEEDPYAGEERCLVDSPRDVADLRPQARDERRARRRDAFVDALARAATSGFGIINFANPDMVGHTGRDPGRGAGGRDGRRVPRPGGRGGARDGRRAASSPPTTATPTTCSSPTAARTPRTR